MINFGQVLTAMVTPFDQNGEIDFEATKNLVNYLIQNGTDGLVVSGTTVNPLPLRPKRKLTYSDSLLRLLTEEFLLLRELAPTTQGRQLPLLKRQKRLE